MSKPVLRYNNQFIDSFQEKRHVFKIYDWLYCKLFICVIMIHMILHNNIHFK